MTNQAAAPANASTSSSSTGTSTAAAVVERACVAAAAVAHSGGCSGARHEQLTPPASSSTHVPPFSHGQARGNGRSGSAAVGTSHLYNSLYAFFLFDTLIGIQGKL